jgi:hypothetical protein
MTRRVSRARAGLSAPASDAAWAAALAAVAADPRLAREPDFPRAVDALRAAAAADPLAAPPGWFEPALDPVDRFFAWCGTNPRPAVDAARAWAAELLLRAVDGTPLVTAAEFAELAAWVRGNEERLRGRADADGVVPLGDGSGAVLDEVLARFGRGPRWPGAGEAAEMARRLRARSGGSEG